ncbi:hypothetical protein Bsp3421_004793 [Burkholderia sp. FERM BP-3421]|uniref:hypothetical protein n=1 Tax=Burkholderia sp. FERM BP-3421 TaxID=1494466 RepID=UPI00235FF761|nr:hypothetical protein [Burkholderia sp. FERM BP-3421]WDD94659.1 hypothetical protein Bsp3421_004793 [Burkholderia sp. FERM BP-3421]
MRKIERMSPAQFFASTVKPTVDEFMTDVQNIRRGRLAAIVLYHMADHAALEGYDGNDRQIMNARLDKLRQELGDACPDFTLIHDIADASKHARLSVPKKAAPRQISTAEQLTRPPGFFGVPFGTGVFNEASWVIVTFDDGKARPLAGIVRSVTEMWEKRLRLCASEPSNNP